LCRVHTFTFKLSGRCAFSFTDRQIQKTGSPRRFTSIPTTLQCDVRLTAALQYFQEKALSANTRAVYNTGARCFLSFTAMHNLQPNVGSLPTVTEDLLVYFVTHCASNLALTYTTIKSYLCGVRNIYIENKYPNPLSGSNGQPLLRLQLVMRGIHKGHRPGHGHQLSKRLPITVDILKNICQILRHGCFGPYLDCLMEAACLLAFFAFLRCGELTTSSSSFSPDINLCLEDIQLVYQHETATEFYIYIKVSKTDPFRQGCRVHIFRHSTAICPIQAMVRYLTVRKPLSADSLSPLFLLPDYSPLSRKSFLHMLDIIMCRLGFNSKLFTGHSFRIGAATSAAKAHVPDHLIQSMGRWKSSCYKTYIRTPKVLFQEAQICMASQTIN
jgi:hypothetical protein